MRLAGWVALGIAAGCESGVTIDVTYRVPGGVAGAYSREAPGVLVAAAWTQATRRPLVAVCGDEVEHVVYSDGFGCKPDDVREETLEAWIVPMPPTWDPALCDAASLDVPVDTGAPADLPLGDLPAPTEADPSGSATAPWRATPICGGTFEAEVVLAAR